MNPAGNKCAVVMYATDENELTPSEETERRFRESYAKLFNQEWIDKIHTPNLDFKLRCDVPGENPRAELREKVSDLKSTSCSMDGKTGFITTPFDWGKRYLVQYHSWLLQNVALPDFMKNMGVPDRVFHFGRKTKKHAWVHWSAHIWIRVRRGLMREELSLMQWQFPPGLLTMIIDFVIGGVAIHDSHGQNGWTPRIIDSMPNEPDDEGDENHDGDVLS
jgi:hypothetical protein